MLSIKENFMRIVNKQVPEYVSTYDLFWAFNMPPFMMGERNPDGTGKDLFGVDQVLGSGVVPAAMPKTHDFILDDITKWRDVIKLPDFSDVDWEIMAKPQLDMRSPDLPFGGGTSMGFFQPLMGIMGFSDGLSAMFEEPDEVKALYEYISDWSIDLAKKYIYYYKPDYGFLADDIAHERNPFLSLEMFKDLVAPYWRRYYDVFTEAGLPCGHHNCGHFELYLDELMDMGVTFWDPVQSSNDLPGIKAKHGNNIALCTHLETRFYNQSTTEEEVRATFRAFVDELAPGGGLALFMMASNDDMPNPCALPGDAERAKWIADEFEKIRYSYYN